MVGHGSLFISVLFVAYVSATNSSFDTGYYWRDYRWTIPRDAFSARRDGERESYIGQAYIQGHGTFVVQIFPGDQEIFAHSYGRIKATGAIKILCSKRLNNFSWLLTNSKFFHVNMTDKNPVVGGFDHVDLNRGMLYVGRLVHHVVGRIGSIDGRVQDAKIRYVHGNAVHTENDFEVLLYNDDIDITRVYRK